ncbi:UNVERIFIED_CONTAM: hypothetical protein RMT77_013294 [Armadillidium vulgare]
MVSSLQNLCFVTLVVDTCNDPDVKEEIYAESTSSFYNRFKNTVQLFAIPKLKYLPPRLFRQVPTYLFPLICCKMVNWANFMESKFGLSLKFCQDFIRTSHFTTLGNIDEKAAAKDLVNDLSLNLVLRFKIACYYYMEDSIIILWPQLPDMKPAVYDKYDAEPFHIWSEYLEKKEKFSTSESELKTINNLFHSQIEHSQNSTTNLSAIKYCYEIEKYRHHHIISYPSNKKKVFSCNYITYPTKYFERFESSFHELLISRDLEEKCNIIAFYFSEMAKGNLSNFTRNEEAQNGLRYLLIWPNQHLFMIAADLLFQYLNPDKYFELLIDIVSLIEDPDFGNTFDYRYLLKEFWTKSPYHLKKYVIDRETGILRDRIRFCYRKHYLRQHLLIYLFDLKNFTSDDEDNFRCILEYATSADKYEILKWQGESICKPLIKNKKYKLARNFIKILNVEEERQKTFIVELLNSSRYLTEKEKKNFKKLF